MNSPRQILERCLFLLSVIFQGASVIFAILGLSTLAEGGSVWLLSGAAGCFVGHWFHQYGCENLHFRDCDRSLTFSEHAAVLPLDERIVADAERLRSLLVELDHRESAGVWALHALRQDVQSLLMATPELRTHCAEDLARHREFLGLSDPLGKRP